MLNRLKINFQGNLILLFSLLCFGVAQAQVPNAPTNLVVTPINTGGMIQFAAPSSIGGSAITNYEYSTNGGNDWITPSRSVTESPLITNSDLTNCTTYSIKIRAVNASGSGTASVAASLTPTASVNQGINWTARTSAAGNAWNSVVYGNGLFVAVATTGTGNRVMTSPDGIAWTSRTSAADIDWDAVTYGNGLFVAAAASGTGNRVMTSTDGITWTSRNSAADNNWFWVTYANGFFVAVAPSGTGNRVMTSTDGITWTSRTSADNNWSSVVYGNGLFVAVAQTGTGNRVMTSSFSVAANAPVITSEIFGNSTTVNFTQSSSTSASSITNYEYSTNNGSNWTAVSPAATTSPLTITGLATVPSSIMIRAVNSVGNSCASNKYLACTPTSSTETISACNSYTWHGILYTASNNTATWTGTNAGGCDSIVTLHLTIANANTGDTTAFACGSFVWYGITYTSSATPTHIITNVGGCDSVITLNLTIAASPLLTSQPTKTGRKVALNLVSSAVPAFTVSATSNTSLSYQWYSNSVASNSGGVLIPGATNASYLPSTSSAYSAYFYCVVSIQNSSCAVASDVSEIFTVCQ